MTRSLRCWDSAYRQLSRSSERRADPSGVVAERGALDANMLEPRRPNASRDTRVNAISQRVAGGSHSSGEDDHVRLHDVDDVRHTGGESVARPVHGRARVSVPAGGSVERVARRPASVASGERCCRRVLLDATMLAALAERAVRIHGDVAEGARRAVRAGPELAVHDDGATDAGAEGEARQALSGQARPGAKLGPRRAVRIVLEPHRHSERRTKTLGQRDVRPAGKVVGAHEELAGGVELTRGTNAACGHRLGIAKQCAGGVADAGNRMIRPSLDLGGDGGARAHGAVACADPELHSRAAEIDSEVGVGQQPWDE